MPDMPVDDDPGSCSVPRGGSWRPGARWARDGGPSRGRVEAEASSLPARRRPTVRELGRRSEAAEHPFRRLRADDCSGSGPGSAPAAPPADRLAAPPLALVARVGRRDELVAVCASAEALGLAPGMAVTQARAFVPDLDVRPAEPGAVAALLEGLALHAVRHWTPVAAPSGVDGLWIDLTGTAHLHGGEERFARRLVAFCRRAGWTARVAIADTPGCAHALARHGASEVTVVPPGAAVRALAPLPLGALRLDADALAAGRRFGFACIADLLAVPRGPLAKRLGLAAVRRLDQATGVEPEPIASVVDEEAPMAERRLLEPIATPEQINRVTSDLTVDLVEALRARGLGARTVRLVASRVDGREEAVAVGTARPSRDAAHLLRLLRLKFDRIDPGLGLETFALVAERCEPLAAVALAGALTDEASARDPAAMLDVLAGRVGADRLFRCVPVASHVPERAVARAAPLATPGRWPDWPRPARLLARPEPLSAVMALLPDQPPRRFEWRGRPHRVTSADGPERIHGEWWRREAETWGVRDYYRVEDEAGGRWWIFRRGDGVDAATGDLSWWMHGVG